MTETAAPEKKRMGWKVWIPVAAVGLVLAYAVIGYLVLPMVAESILPDKLSAALHRSVRIADVAVDPFRLTVAVRGLEIDETGGRPFARVGEIFADAELAPALAGTWTLTALRISGPQISILRAADGAFNFSDMAPKEAAPANKAQENDDPARFRIRALKLEDGRVAFEDRTLAMPFQSEAAPIHLAVENLTNLDGEEARFRLSLSTKAGETVAVRGKAALAKLRAETELTLSNLPLEKYAPYFRNAVGFDLVSGRLGLTASAAFGTTTGKSDDLQLKADSRIENLSLQDRKTGRPVVELDRLAVGGASADLAAAAAAVASVETTGLRVYAMVDETGESSLARLAPKTGEKADAPASAPAGDGGKTPPWKLHLGALVLSDVSLAASGLNAAEGAGEGSPVAEFSRLAVEGVDLKTDEKNVAIRQISWKDGAVHGVRDARGRIDLARLAGDPATAEKPAESGQEATPDPASPWIAEVETLGLENWTVSFEDRVPAEPLRLTLSNIGMSVSGFSTRPENRFDLALALGVNETGSVDVEGTAGLNPLAADLAVSTQGIDIRPAQSYLEDQVRLLITGGRFENKGRIALASAPGGGVSLRYTGSAAVTEFATVDKEKARDLVKWNSLYLSAMDIGTAPLRVDIGEVALTDFFTRIIVNEEGGLNLTDVLTTKAEGGDEKAPDPAGEKASKDRPEIRIATVTLQGGRVRFSDRQIQPNFETEFMDLGGSVSGLSSENLARADVLLEGRLDNHAPLKITGQINPLIENRYTDLKIAFSDIEMSPFTPYSGKYLGYVLDKGKLSLDLSYRVSDRRLEAENRVRFDQLTLGDRVESPQATSLPIGLALSLLEDRDGVIDLDLPIRGNLDDPEFSVGRIVLKMLVNLVKKIITAPFAALGSLFGGGAEMSEVDFAPGVVTLDDGQRQQLDKLAEALYKRPKLRLDIQGEVAPEEDRDALRRIRFDDLLVASKIQDRVKKGLPVQPREEMAVSAEEYETYLAAAYDAADFPKPREADGRIKELPPEEKEKLLYTHITVTDDDLRQMAAERAGGVKTYLLETGKVAPERVFLKEPAPVTQKEGDEDDERKSRVVFSLK